MVNVEINLSWNIFNMSSVVTQVRETVPTNSERRGYIIIIFLSRAYR